MIEVKNLFVTIKAGRKAEPFSVKDVNFSLEQGYFMGLLGKNGSGKTTLLRMLGGVLEPNGGEVCLRTEEGSLLICSLQDIRYKQEVAYVEAETGVFLYGTVQEHIKRQSMFFPSFDEKLLHEYLTRLDFSQRDLVSVVEHLSQGAQMKLKLACAMARNPKLLLLDEPTANMDPVMRVKLMELLQEQLTRGTSIIMSSHIVSDMEDIMDFVGVMEQGEMVWFSDREEYAVSEYGQKGEYLYE